MSGHNRTLNRRAYQARLETRRTGSAPLTMKEEDPGYWIDSESRFSIERQRTRKGITFIVTDLSAGRREDKLTLEDAARFLQQRTRRKVEFI